MHLCMCLKKYATLKVLIFREVTEVFEKKTGLTISLKIFWGYLKRYEKQNAFLHYHCLALDDHNSTYNVSFRGNHQPLCFLWYSKKYTQYQMAFMFLIRKWLQTFQYSRRWNRSNKRQRILVKFEQINYLPYGTVYRFLRDSLTANRHQVRFLIVRRW